MLADFRGMIKDPLLGHFRTGRRMRRDSLVQINWPSLFTRAAYLVAVELLYTVCRYFKIVIVGSGDDMDTFEEED